MSHKRIRKVLLIQPPAFMFRRGDINPNVPLGIAYIAAVLEREGYTVRMLDAFIEGWHREEQVSPGVIRVGLPFEEIKEIIAAEAPDVVGITSMFTSQRKNAHRLAAVVREVAPSIFVVMGGAHPTSAPEMVLADPNVDVIVLGEGENSIVPLLQTLEGGSDLGALDGIGYRDHGRVIIKPQTQHVLDLDSIPFPARHLLPMEKYFSAGVRHGGFSRRDRATSILTSRGCPYRCNFCTAFKVFGRRTRFRSAPNVIAEIEELVTRFGVNELFLEDDQFMGKRKRTEELLDAMIAKGFDLTWDTPNGVSPWPLTDSILARMKASGCYRVNLAVESGNQWVLDNIIHKPVKVDKIPETVRLIRRHGMRPGMFLVVGNIGERAVETIEQIRDSFRLARQVGVMPHVSLLTPYPGSEVLDVAKNKGYLISGFDWDDLIITKGNLQTPEWTPEELSGLVEQELRETKRHLVLHRPQMYLLSAWRSLRCDPRGFPKRVSTFVKKLI